MSDHVYKVVKIVGSSPEGVQQAIDNALDKASDSVRNMRWFEVEEIRGQIKDGTANHYQVALNVGFTLE
jgi:flavin-binding protein dodecin